MRTGIGETAAGRLRRAVEQGACEEATRLAGAYARQVQQTLQTLPADSAEAMALVSEAKDLFEWARRAALAWRAGLATRLKSLPSPHPYAVPRQRVSSTWSLEA